MPRRCAVLRWFQKLVTPSACSSSVQGSHGNSADPLADRQFNYQVLKWELYLDVNQMQCVTIDLNVCKTTTLREVSETCYITLSQRTVSPLRTYFKLCVES